MDTEELRSQLASGKLKLDDKSVEIRRGKLTNHLGEEVDYKIHHGWNIISAMECDQQWGAFSIEMFEHIRKQNYSEEELGKVLGKLHIEDYHWNWFKKAIFYADNQYEWFFIYANKKPQGACLIYHPKTSAIDQKKVFYIEFVAVAPWNRINPLQKKEFSKVGTNLINCAMGYSVNTLGLAFGFSLHSLPKAVGYYKKIGMINFDKMDNGKLVYFEMPRNKAKEILGAS